MDMTSSWGLMVGFIPLLPEVTSTTVGLYFFNRKEYSRMILIQYFSWGLGLRGQRAAAEIIRQHQEGVMMGATLRLLRYFVETLTPTSKTRGESGDHFPARGARPSPKRAGTWARFDLRRCLLRVGARVSRRSRLALVGIFVHSRTWVYWLFERAAQTGQNLRA
jgi:hypothetical protein